MNYSLNIPQKGKTFKYNDVLCNELDVIRKYSVYENDAKWKETTDGYVWILSS